MIDTDVRSQYAARRHPRRAFADALLALGLRTYEQGIDDGRTGELIRRLDERIRRATGANAAALAAGRERLLRRLAVAALEDDAPMPGADAEYEAARAAESALARDEALLPPGTV